MLTNLVIFGKKLVQQTLQFMKTREYAIGQLVSFGQTLNHSLWWKSSLVAVAMAISDFTWARYIAAIANSDSFASANWGIVVVVLGAFVVVSYVSDKRLIIPAALGAWIGTYLAV